VGCRRVRRGAARPSAAPLAGPIPAEKFFPSPCSFLGPLPGAGVSFRKSTEILFNFGYLAHVLSAATKLRAISGSHSRIAFELQ
jgi:hypothetical protein